jgi:patatin-like phospholipase/acyl hydrolase
VEQPKLKAALVKDVCLATTAAPTFLPPASFTVPPTEDTPTEDKKKKKEEEKDHTKKNPQTLQFNMIDGGMVANNPVGFSSGLFSSTFYDYKSIFKTYTCTNCHF